MAVNARDVPDWIIPTGWTAGNIGHCRSCGAPIMWARTPSGGLGPLDHDGKSHFATCPQADRWRRPRAVVADATKPAIERGASTTADGSRGMDRGR